MSTAEELGDQAYQKAMWDDYKGSIAILDKAIAKYPRDPRLYNNRCYCNFKLKDYKRALSEAEFMIREFPTFTRGFYRKAEILVETKRLTEAEAVLHDLLKLDSNCQEAKYLLSEVQIMLLCVGGKYSVNDAMRALQLTNFNTEQAKAFLEVGGMTGANSYDRSEIYYSDEDIEEPSTSAAAARNHVQDSDYDPYVDPSNPFKSNAIWVGNVTKKITEENLKPLFTKFGKIKSIIVQHQNFCAFVNYVDPSMASTAMKKFQQYYPMEDTTLIIRFPDNAKTNLALGGKKNGIKINPSNPLQSNAIWVGNVTKKITEENLKPLFTKFGKIKSIIVQHQNFCAFVNYEDPSMASTAMKKFQQYYPIEDTSLIIRFPHNAKTNLTLGGKKNGINTK